MSDPFLAGQRYRVKRSFEALRSSFEEGEVLIYSNSAYSRYDGITGYIFSFEDLSGSRVWDVYDHESTSGWKDLFEPLPAAPPVAQRGG